MIHRRQTSPSQLRVINALQAARALLPVQIAESRCSGIATRFFDPRSDRSAALRSRVAARFIVSPIFHPGNSAASARGSEAFSPRFIHIRELFRDVYRSGRS